MKTLTRIHSSNGKKHTVNSEHHPTENHAIPLKGSLVSMLEKIMYRKMAKARKNTICTHTGMRRDDLGGAGAS